MPELPEVEIFRRRFAANALRRRIDAVGAQRAGVLDGISARQFSARLIGRRFTGVARHGKRLYCRLDRNGWMAVHFGLTGDLVPYRDREPEPAFARVVIDFAGGTRLAYVNRRMIGRIGFVEDPARDVEAKGLGPDALDPKLTAATFRARVGAKRGPIKAVLMDQAVIAGIGNEYSDEILFQCRLHPLTPAHTLDARALGRLFRATRRVLEKSIAVGADHEKLPRTYLLRARRAGAPCPRCGGKVARLHIGGRSGYFCRSCQRKTGSE
ncbi:MAG TPA: DNA-formamidopyrimidine glycosylase family protein [Burkholderiales bacterium]